MKSLRLAVVLPLVLLSAALAQTPAVPLKLEDYTPPIRIACVGDSITFGSGIKDRQHDSYPAQLGRMLGDKFLVRNFGVSGSTMLNKGDKPYTKEKAFAAALEFKPDVLIVKLGTNDSKPQNWQHKQEFGPDARELIARFRAVNPKLRVYLCLPVPAFPGNWGIRDSIIKDQAIPVLREVAQLSKTDLIDLYAALEGKSEFFPDKVHPNAAGATVMAATICRALTGKEAPAK